MAHAGRRGLWAGYPERRMLAAFPGVCLPPQPGREAVTASPALPRYIRPVAPTDSGSRPRAASRDAACAGGTFSVSCRLNTSHIGGAMPVELNGMRLYRI